MNLHRALRHEWSNIPHTQQNIWQRLATQTNGIITPANFVSIAGAITLLFGLYFLATKSFLLGTLLVVVGRLADILDGYLADKTGTKSPVGEAVDASIDKFEALVAIIVFTLVGIVPWYVTVVFISHTAFGAGIFWLAHRRGERIHPSLSGKLATTVEWIVLASYVIAYTSVGTIRAFALGVSALGLVIFSTFAVKSAGEYIHEYKKIGAGDA